MKTGFLILNYNSWELTQHLAQKVATYQNISRVIVIDNASTDDSYNHLVKLASDRIILLRSDRNGGYSYGNNLGARFCAKENMDILFFSNPDVEVKEDDINKIIAGFKASDYSVLSGIEYNSEGIISLPPIWTLMKYKDDLLDCFYIGRKYLKHKKETILDKSIPIQQVEIVKGSFFSIRLQAFMEVGMFDENVFLYCEERILARKLLNAGKKAGIVTNAVYQHNHSASITNTYHSATAQMKLLYQSRLYYHKAYETSNGLKLILLKLAMKISLAEYRLRDAIAKKRLGV